MATTDGQPFLGQSEVVFHDRPYTPSHKDENKSQPDLASPSRAPLSKVCPEKRCWDRGCNGHQFPTLGDLSKHQRENAQIIPNPKFLCPRCGADFSRETALAGYLAHDECERRMSKSGQSRTSKPSELVQHSRALSMPDSSKTVKPTMIMHQKFAELLKFCESGRLLLLDLRVFPKYSKSRIRGAISLCIPTTLLKRPSFEGLKLSQTLKEEHDKANFALWREAQFIVVYDTGSSRLEDAKSAMYTLKKLTNEGWNGTTYIIRGGFRAFPKNYPEKIDKMRISKVHHSDEEEASLYPFPDGASIESAADTALWYIISVFRNTYWSSIPWMAGVFVSGVTDIYPAHLQHQKFQLIQLYRHYLATIRQ